MNRNQASTWKTKPFRTARLVLAWTGLALLPLAATGCGHRGEAAEDGENHTGPRVVEVETTEPVRKSDARDRAARATRQSMDSRITASRSTRRPLSSIIAEPVFMVRDF